MTLWLLALSTLAGAASALPSDAGTKVMPLEVKTEVTPKQVQLGQPFVYEIKISHQKNERWDLRAPSNLGPFEWLEQLRNRTDESQAATTVFRVKLALFELGEKKIPELTFKVVTDNAVQTFVLPGSDVQAISSLNESEQKATELKDIKPPEEVPVRSYRILWFGLAAIAAGALAYLAHRWWRKPRIPVAPVLPPKPPEVIALAALDQLRAENLPAQGRIREYYFRLSEILRAYLGRRYSFEALECTSSELLAAMKEFKLMTLSLPPLEAFAHECDFVKFAKGEVGLTECDRALEYAYSVVRQTTPVATTLNDAVRTNVS